VIIEARYNGPPGTGNGGYSSGLVASYVDSPAPAGVSAAVVTLRLPPPLDVPLRVTADESGVRVHDSEDRLIATGAPLATELEVLPAVPLDEAVDAATRYPGLEDHPFPTCFVCGPARADGLGIFPGPVGTGPGGGDRTAAPWTVPADVTPEMVWAALDCPGGWAIISPGRPYVLGRMAAVVTTVPTPGTTCVVTGECVRVDGRKGFVRTAVHAPDATVIGQAEATWIAL